MFFFIGGSHGHSHGGGSKPKRPHSHGTHSHLAALADEEDDRDSCYREEQKNDGEPKSDKVMGHSSMR